MVKENDTIDGLLAEFRGYSAGMPAGYHVAMSWADFRRMLDRFDAAHNREIEEAERRANHAAMKNVSETLAKVGPLYDAESIGNAAKLREALRECALCVACLGEIGAWEVTINDNVHLIPEKLVQKAVAALAAPPRNCDRFASAEEAWDAYDEWVESYRAKGKVPPFNEFGWLFAPATEKKGGAK